MTERRGPGACRSLPAPRSAMTWLELGRLPPVWRRTRDPDALPPPAAVPVGAPG